MDNIIIIPGFYFKYCYNCKLFYIKNYKNIICYNCEKKCSYFNFNTLYYYKPLMKNINYLIGIIWRLYNLNDYYTFSNYYIFEQIIKKIFKLIIANSDNSDLLFYIINAYLLQINRNKNKKNKFNNNNFNYELNMLILDFYFSIIYLNDYNMTFTKWKNEIDVLHNHYFKHLYKYYIIYLQLLNYNICINIYSYYFILEYIINHN